MTPSTNEEGEEHHDEGPVGDEEVAGGDGHGRHPWFGRSAVAAGLGARVAAGRAGGAVDRPDRACYLPSEKTKRAAKTRLMK